MHNNLRPLEQFYLALGDKTRLRLLAIMGNGEMCVQHFSGIAGESQPKISRHLAYLRAAGLVDTRRDGKRIYYRIRWPDDDLAYGALHAAVEWAASLVGTADAAAFSQAQAQRAPPAPAADRHAYEQAPAHNELDEFLL